MAVVSQDRFNCTEILYNSPFLIGRSLHMHSWYLLPRIFVLSRIVLSRECTILSGQTIQLFHMYNIYCQMVQYMYIHLVLQQCAVGLLNILKQMSPICNSNIRLRG